MTCLLQLVTHLPFCSSTPCPSPAEVLFGFLDCPWGWVKAPASASELLLPSSVILSVRGCSSELDVTPQTPAFTTKVCIFFSLKGPNLCHYRLHTLHAPVHIKSPVELPS